MNAAVILIIGLVCCCVLLLGGFGVYYYSKNEECKKEGKVFNLSELECGYDEGGSQSIAQQSTTEEMTTEELIQQQERAAAAAAQASTGNVQQPVKRFPSAIDDFSEEEKAAMETKYLNEGVFTFCAYKNANHEGDHKLITIDKATANDGKVYEHIPRYMSEQGNYKSMFYDPDDDAMNGKCVMVLGDGKYVKEEDYIFIRETSSEKYLMADDNNSLQYVDNPNKQCNFKVDAIGDNSSITLKATKLSNSSEDITVNITKFTKMNDNSFKLAFDLTVNGTPEYVPDETTFQITIGKLPSANVVHPRCLYTTVDKTGEYMWQKSGQPTVNPTTQGATWVLSDPATPDVIAERCRFPISATEYLEENQEYYIMLIPDTGNMGNMVCKLESADNRISWTSPSSVFRDDETILFKVEFADDNEGVKIKSTSVDAYINSSFTKINIAPGIFKLQLFEASSFKYKVVKPDKSVLSYQPRKLHSIQIKVTFHKKGSIREMKTEDTDNSVNFYANPNQRTPYDPVDPRPHKTAIDTNPNTRNRVQSVKVPRDKVLCLYKQEPKDPSGANREYITNVAAFTNQKENVDLGFTPSHYAVHTIESSNIYMTPDEQKSMCAPVYHILDEKKSDKYNPIIRDGVPMSKTGNKVATYLPRPDLNGFDYDNHWKEKYDDMGNQTNDRLEIPYFRKVEVNKWGTSNFSTTSGNTRNKNAPYGTWCNDNTSDLKESKRIFNKGKSGEFTTKYASYGWHDVDYKYHKHVDNDLETVRPLEDYGMCGQPSELISSKGKYDNETGWGQSSQIKQ